MVQRRESVSKESEESAFHLGGAVEDAAHTAGQWSLCAVPIEVRLLLELLVSAVPVLVPLPVTSAWSAILEEMLQVAVTDFVSRIL
jgi:hypothetical protein